MIRLLIIGRPGAAWAQRIKETVGEAVEVDTARLPSAGIRQFDTTPPDAILIADDRGGERVETLVQAIRNRPLGQLVPVVLLCPLPLEGDIEEKLSELDLLGWLPLEASVHELWRIIDDELDLSESMEASQVDAPTSRPSPTDSPEQDSKSSSPGQIFLEPLDESEENLSTKRRSIFPTRGGFQVGRLDAETIDRKLKEVRHQDYYAVLEVRRGAESQTVREAFHQLVARFDPQAMDFEIAHRYQNELDEIHDALEDAWAVLGDPDLRQPYLTHTLRK
ncbi:MAG: DnaJ domain-containing protein [Bradymonadaceae bacterium]